MLEFVAESETVPMHIHKNEDEHFIILEGSLHIAVGAKVLGAICRTLRSEELTVSQLCAKYGPASDWCRAGEGICIGPPKLG
jgi:hypothetical protein